MKKLLISVLAIAVLSACQPTIPKDALELTAESLEQRQRQSRRYETSDEKKLLVASAQVLQDLGYNIEESETGLGVIVASKDRDATNGAQIAMMIFIAALGGQSNTAIDKDQKIRVSLITRPIDKKNTSVRVTFQQLVWNTQGQLTRAVQLDDPKLYQEFFEKLSESVFLTANEI